MTSSTLRLKRKKDSTIFTTFYSSIAVWLRRNNPSGSTIPFTKLGFHDWTGSKIPSFYHIMTKQVWLDVHILCNVLEVGPRGGICDLWYDMSYLCSLESTQIFIGLRLYCKQIIQAVWTLHTVELVIMPVTLSYWPGIRGKAELVRFILDYRAEISRLLYDILENNWHSKFYALHVGVEFDELHQDITNAKGWHLEKKVELAKVNPFINLPYRTVQRRKSSFALNWCVNFDMNALFEVWRWKDQWWLGIYVMKYTT